MKKLLLTVSLIVLSVSTTWAFQAPNITMTTTKTVGTTFSFYMKASAPNTNIYIDFGDGNLLPFSLQTSLNYITGTLGSTQVVKIYGNQITYLDIEEKNINQLDVSGATTLSYLNASNDLLTSLDVTANTQLEYLTCSYNSLTSLAVAPNNTLDSLICSSNSLSTLNLSGSKILKTLHCENNQLTSLNLSSDTLLNNLYCFNNLLSSLDVSSNTALTYLNVNQNLLPNLNVSANTLLQTLSCDYNLLKNLDVSSNSALTYLSCFNDSLKTLDITHNPNLSYLNCSSNQLTSLDVHVNTLLTYLACSTNQLSSLNISACPLIDNLFCDSNKFDFSTLPIIYPSSAGTFYYIGQSLLQIPKTLNVPWGSVDLSSQLTNSKGAKQSVTYIWYTNSGRRLIQGSDYTASNGVFTFLKTQSDSVYCVLSSPAFPDFVDPNPFVTSGMKLIQVISGVESLHINFSVYPNPVVDYVQVQGDENEGGSITVIDVMGRTIKRISSINSTETIDASSWSPGIYYIRVDNNGKLGQQTIIKH